MCREEGWPDRTSKELGDSERDEVERGLREREKLAGEGQEGEGERERTSVAE